MKLSALVAYLERRFPAQAEVVDIELSIIAEPNSGLIETVTNYDSGEADDPDDGEALPKDEAEAAPRLVRMHPPRLKAV